ncbi:MAG: hypothetical protein Q8O62_10025 [Aequorivita sp.]|nr:hypothetical protein [Aequorivita sp.]
MGSILFASGNTPVFMPGLCIKENNNSIVTSWTSLSRFHRFCNYVKEIGLFADRSRVRCVFATLKGIFLEFEEMDQTDSISSLLFPNNIAFAWPEAIALNPAAVNGKFNIWLRNARRYFGNAAGFFFSRALDK